MKNRDYPGLRKRGERYYWIDVQIHGKRIHRSLKTRNREVARRRYDEIREAAESGKTPVERKTNLEWLDLCVRAAKGKAVAHLGEVERINRLFFEDSGARYPEDLDGTAAQEWLLAYGERHGKNGKVSARTLKKYAQHLGQYGRFLFRHRRRNGLTQNPFELLEFSATEADRVYLRRHYKLPELFKLLGAAPPYRALVYYAAAFTGLRRKELSRLTWQDVGEGWLRLNASVTKNKKRRGRHPIPAELSALLSNLRAGCVSMVDLRGRRCTAYRSAGSALEDAVFVCIPGTETLRRDLRAAEIVYETPDGVLDFHSLRSAFASLLEFHKVGLSTAQKLLRHSDPRLTANVYQGLDYDELAGALDAVGETAAQLGSVIGGAVRNADKGAAVELEASNEDGSGTEAVGVVKTVVNCGESPDGIAPQIRPEAPRWSASNRSKLLAGPTRNRNERPCCSHGPAVLKTVADTSRH
jgi:integrase